MPPLYDRAISEGCGRELLEGRNTVFCEAVCSAANVLFGERDHCRRVAREAMKLDFDSCPPGVSAPPPQMAYYPAVRDFVVRFNAAGRGVTGSVTSWYRDAERNRACGGAETSQHLLGLAADFVVAPADQDYAVARMTEAGLTVVPEADHVHVQRYARSPLST